MNHVRLSMTCQKCLFIFVILQISTETMNGDCAHLELELKLNEATERILGMRKRERELTDR